MLLRFRRGIFDPGHDIARRPAADTVTENMEWTERVARLFLHGVLNNIEIGLSFVSMMKLDGNMQKLWIINAWFRSLPPLSPLSPSFLS